MCVLCIFLTRVSHRVSYLGRSKDKKDLIRFWGDMDSDLGICFQPL